MVFLLYVIIFTMTLFINNILFSNLEKVNILILTCLNVIFIFYIKDSIILHFCKEYKNVSTYVTKIIHYEAWNEWITETCDEEVKVGVDSRGFPIYKTVSRDCSYSKYHPDEYKMFLHGVDNNITINEKEYKRILKLLNKKEEIEILNRNYYTINGNMLYSTYDYDIKNMVPIVYEKKYFKYTKTTSSLFSYDKPKTTNGLIQYPENNLFDFKSVLSELALNDITKGDESLINKFNSKYSLTKDIFVYFIIFKNSDIDIVNKQKALWEGGQINEVVFCINLDDNCNIEWVDYFSWTDESEFEILVKNKLIESKGMTLDFDGVYSILNDNIKYFKGKNNDDFNYISHKMTIKSFIALLYISLTITIVTFFLIDVLNKYLYIIY